MTGWRAVCYHETELRDISETTGEEDCKIMLKTTIAGSLPKPSWLAEPEKL